MKVLRIIAFCIFLTGGSLGAKEVKVTSTDKLYRLLAAAPYSLLMFYRRDKQAMRDPVTRQNITDTEIMLKSLSRSPFYKGTGIQIIMADVSQGGLTQAMEDYGITTLPTFITVVGREKVGEPLSGFAYRAAIMTFINTHLKNQMESYQQARAAEREREFEQARIDAYNRNYWLGSPYWDSYWYGGYYPYWYGPYFW